MSPGRDKQRLCRFNPDARSRIDCVRREMGPRQSVLVVDQRCLPRQNRHLRVPALTSVCLAISCTRWGRELWGRGNGSDGVGVVQNHVYFFPNPVPGVVNRARPAASNRFELFDGKLVIRAVAVPGKSHLSFSIMMMRPHHGPRGRAHLLIGVAGVTWS